jgi:hypothetical protein
MHAKNYLPRLFVGDCICRIHIFPFNSYVVINTNVDLCFPFPSLLSVYISMKMTVGKIDIILPYRYCIFVFLIILWHGYWSNTNSWYKQCSIREWDYFSLCSLKNMSIWRLMLVIYTWHCNTVQYGVEICVHGSYSSMYLNSDDKSVTGSPNLKACLVGISNAGVLFILFTRH